MPQFYHDGDLSEISDYFYLSVEESRHIKVLRYSKGDKIKVFDADGRRYEAEIIDFRDGLVCVRPLKRIVINAKRFRLKLYVPFIEKSAFEFVIRHCTETGADEFVPMRTEYSQGNFAQKLAHKRERLKEIILSSVKQCERPGIPVLSGETVFAQAISCEKRPVVLHMSGGAGQKALAPAQAVAEMEENISLFVGPEAGFSPAEIALAAQRKAVFMDIGPYLLRTQTAAVAACAVISALKK